jgi:hypothetical protein
MSERALDRSAFRGEPSDWRPEGPPRVPQGGALAAAARFTDPGQLVPLSRALASAPEDHEAVPGFTVSLDGELHRVTAVLDRTAVFEPVDDRWAGRRTARFDLLWVDPDSLTWRLKATAWLERARARGRARRRRRAGDRARGRSGDV